MTNSTSPKSARKPVAKLPVWPKSDGRWCRKIKGRFHYFGKVADDPTGEAATKLWLEQKDDLLAGRTPRGKAGDGLTLGTLANKFLTAKRASVGAGTLSPRTFVEYGRTCDLLIAEFGARRLVDDIRPDDFTALYAKLTKLHGLTTLGREVTMVRSVFKFAVESDLVERAVKFGPQFKSPKKADKRKLRAKTKQKNGRRMFDADELRAMIDAAAPQLKAMLLLGANAGLGNTDCASLPLSALDLDRGWLDFPRPKTGIDRRAKLWPETVSALKAVIAKRPAAKDPANADLVFITRVGQPWVRYELGETKDEDGGVKITGRADDAISKATAKLLAELGTKRAGVNFYALRHGFETVAGGTADQVAVDSIMGHVDSSMAGEYREHIEDRRLIAVASHVRAWLFPATVEAERKAAEAAAKPARKPRKAKAEQPKAELRIVG